MQPSLFGVAKKALMPPDILARKGSVPVVCLTAYTTPIAALKRFPPDLNRRDSQRVRNERILVH